jgi:hypothetical protein
MSEERFPQLPDFCSSIQVNFTEFFVDLEGNISYVETKDGIMLTRGILAALCLLSASSLLLIAWQTRKEPHPGPLLALVALNEAIYTWYSFVMLYINNSAFIICYMNVSAITGLLA